MKRARKRRTPKQTAPEPRGMTAMVLTAQGLRSAHLGPGAKAFLTGQDLIPSGEKITKPYAQHPTIHVAVSTIATSIAQLEVEVWEDGASRKRGGDAPVDGHWLPALMQSPDPVLRGDQLMQAIVISLLLNGEAFLWPKQLARDNANAKARPNTILMLPPASMSPNIVKNQFVGWWWSSPSGRVPIALDEITFLKLYNPYDPIRGLSKLSAAALEYNADFGAAKWNQAFYENSALPAIVFYVESKDDTWPREERETFLEAWDEKYAGASRAHMAAALPEGVKAQILKMTQMEMDFLNGRRFTREQVLGIFGVYPAVAGIFEAGKFANSREQLKFYWQKTVLPMVRYIESVLTVDLLKRSEPTRSVFFKTEPVMAEVLADDFSKKIEAATKLMAMGFPPADINDRLELGMDTEGKPWLDVGYLPFSLAPAGGGDAAAGDDDEEVPEAVPARMVPALKAAESKVRRELEARRQWQGLARQWGDIGRGYQRRLRSWVHGLKRETLENLRRVGRELTRTMQKIDEGDLDNILWNDESGVVKLREISEKAWKRSMQRGVEVLATSTGLAIDFDFNDPAVSTFLASKRIKIVRVSDTIREAVRNQISDGIAGGETVDELSQRVSSVFVMERRRALTIARTETAQAFAGGRFNAMKQVGIQKHRWLTSQDGRVRDTHEAQDGEVVIVGETFSNGLKYPGDPDSPDAGETINCRCGTIPEESVSQEEFEEAVL